MAPGALLSWASVSPSFWVGSVCHAGLQAGPPVCPWDVRAFVRLPQGLCGPKLAPPPQPVTHPETAAVVAFGVWSPDASGWVLLARVLSACSKTAF